MAEFTSLNGYDVKDKKAVRVYDNVEAMKEDYSIRAGETVQTLGFYQPNDGGGSTYMIRTRSGSDNVDEMKIISLYDNTLVAKLSCTTNIINIKQFGAYCDNTHDDSDALETCLNYAGTLALSGGTYRRTVLIPAVVKVTRRIDCTTDQFKMLGTSLNNSKIIFNGATSYLNFAKSDNSRIYELEIENVRFYGDYSQTQSILKFTKGNNIYLRRVETCNGGVNQYNISFIDTGIIFMDECTIVGSNNVTDYPGNRNGIYVNKLGSIFNFTNANCWNLNNLFKFDGNLQNINIERNWIECIKSFVEVACVKDMRGMNFKVCGNTINTHAQSEAFYPTTFNFFDFTMQNDTEINGSNITFDDNTVYLWDVTSIKGNTFVYFDQIGNSTSNNFNINYNRNIYTGKTLYQLSAYIFYNTTNAFYNTNTIRITSFTPTRESDRLSITDQLKIVGCGYTGKTARIHEFPNGVYLAHDCSYNAGNIYYDSGHFYGGYGGSVKSLPEKVVTNLHYATDTSDVVTVVNSIVDTLYQARITNIPS